MTSSQGVPAAVTFCACGCGEVVKTPGARWARGHFHRGEGTYEPLPGPGEAPDLDGILAEDDREYLAAPRGSDGAELGGPGAEFPGAGGDFLENDPDPAPLGGDRAAGPRAGPAPPMPARVAKDIEAKFNFLLDIPGQLWKVKDPYCGGRFLEQRPVIAKSWARLACESPDVVEWLTGEGGKFLLLLDAGASAWPVIEMIFAHHVTRTVGKPRAHDGAQPGPRVPVDRSIYVA